MQEKNNNTLDPVAEFILEILSDGQSVAPVDIARALGATRQRPRDKPDAWRRFLMPVKQQMVYLARNGRIEILRKGVVTDPDNFRGVVRLRLRADA